MVGLSSLRNLKQGLSKRSRAEGSETPSPGPSTPAIQDAPPPKLVKDSITEFCSIDAALQEGREIALLPVIVEAAGAGPDAAEAAAKMIRGYLVTRHDYRPYEQYNAIMLLRILVKNPGPPFTTYMNPKFIDVVRKLLKENSFINVQQIMRQTLDMWSKDTSLKDDQSLQPMFAMWEDTKEREKKKASVLIPQNITGHLYPTPGRVPYEYPPNGQPTLPGQGSRSQSGQTPSSNKLPSQAELATRTEEAKNTGKIFMQMIQSTSPDDLHDNELVKELYTRCQSAQKGMLGYINCEDPAPDNDTMQTLIEINEQLSMAISRYQRAKLQATRTASSAANTPPPQREPEGATVAGNRLDNVASANYFDQSQAQALPSRNPYLTQMQQQQQQTNQPAAPSLPNVASASLLDEWDMPVRSQAGSTGVNTFGTGPTAPAPLETRSPTQMGQTTSAAPQLQRPLTPDRLQSPFSDQAEPSNLDAKAASTAAGNIPSQRQAPPHSLSVGASNGHANRNDDDEDDLYAVSPVSEKAHAQGKAY